MSKRDEYYNEVKNKIIICDLDGTIANIEHRLHYLKGPKKDWDSFNEMCYYDKPYKDVIHILETITYDPEKTYFFSGRSAKYWMHTVDWLETHVDFCEAGFNFHDQLFMRKEGDFRDDVEVKREMIKNLQIRKWNRSEATFPLEQVTPDDVLCILDDRQGVVDMWREEGFRCLQVNAWKEEPKRHHLMDADLDDLNMAELKFLVERLKKNLLLDEVLAEKRGVSTKEAMSVLLEENDKAQLPRVYYHSWITGPQGARFEIFKSNHSTEVINETKKRLRYDQDVVKIYVVNGEPEDYDHKKERLEFYDIEENDNG